LWGVHRGRSRRPGGATISVDGKYVFFKQGERFSVANDSTNRDLYWVDIRIIENVRPKEGR
jgi:hypothetical protein